MNSQIIKELLKWDNMKILLPVTMIFLGFQELLMSETLYYQFMRYTTRALLIYIIILATHEIGSILRNL